MRRFSAIIFSIAIILRLAVLVFPASSTDTQRFLADGLNVVAGKNPYTAPAPIEIQYAHLRSFYPPLQELFFGAAVLLWPNPKIFRILAGAAELLFLIWFFRRKRARQLPLPLALFLLFNPLSIHEIWREGHLDHIGAVFLYWAIVARGWKKYAFTFTSIAWKFIGIFAVAFRRRWLFVIASIGFFAAQFVPAVLFTPFAENGLTVYKTYWHHGNGLVHMLVSRGFGVPHAIYLNQWLIFIVCVAIALLHFLRRLGLMDAISLGLGSLLVLFPVQHPWYYFLLFPLVLLSPNWRNLLMLICCLAPLSYLGYVENYKSAGFFVVLVVWLLGIIIHFTRRKNYRYR